MKFLPLVWSGIWRKPARTILTLLQVIVAFALFGVLQGMKMGMDQAVADARADVLYVAPVASGGAPLPRAYIERLRSIGGVKTAAFADAFFATYQTPKQPVYVLALESSDVWLTLFPEVLEIGPRDLRALQETRTGVLISAGMARQYGWRIGDQIPLTSTTMQSNGSGTWYFDIVGTFAAREIGDDSGGYIVANYDYLDEARVLNKGTVRNFYAIAADPKQAAVVAEAIDNAFANSPNETRTASFKENAQQAMQSIGDLDFAIRSIVSAVLVALLFSVATMMMQTFRERTPELAVLKTLGFSDRTVFLLLVTEAVVACVVGAVIGLGLAMVAFPYAEKFVPGLSMPMAVIEIGVAGAVLVALLSTVVPAFRASKLEIVDALADR
jgi:putative ABC transport system permease protein